MAIYKVPKGEDKLVHVQLEKQLFNQTTGKKVSNSFVQKFEPTAWANVKTNLLSLGYSRIEVLHPTNDEKVAFKAIFIEGIARAATEKELKDGEATLMVCMDLANPKQNKAYKAKKAAAKNTPPAEPGDDEL